MGLSTDLGAGSELLGYRIERVLGRGGMGVVYLAHQVVLDRMVALKLLAPELAEDDHFRDRFLRESRLAASLEHPAIVPIFDAGEVEGRLYISMRYVEGTDLRRLLDVEAPLAPERAVGLLGPIAGALDAAHARGLVHRDVKPANILIGEDDRPFLADFGLTREVSEGGGLEQSHFAASVDYVAPEQIARGAVGPPADVYSLGCVLFECLTGRPPFSSDSVIAALWGHVNEPPPAASERQPALPKAIDAVFARALAKDPAERYGSCRGLIDAAQHPLGLERRRPWRSARVVAAAALVAVAAVVALVVSLGRGGTPKPALHVTSNSLVRIDPATNRVAAVTPVGSRIGTATLLPGAEGVAVGADSVWVYNWDGHAVWVIDPETNDVDRTVGIAGSTPFGPSNSIAADARGAWVLSGNAGESVLTHVAPGIEFARRFAFAYDPLVVAVGRGSVWIGGKRLGSSEVVLRVDPDSGAVRAVVPLRGAAIDTEVSGVGTSRRSRSARALSGCSTGARCSGSTPRRRVSQRGWSSLPARPWRSRPAAARSGSRSRARAAPRSSGSIRRRFASPVRLALRRSRRHRAAPSPPTASRSGGAAGARALCGGSTRAPAASCPRSGFGRLPKRRPSPSRRAWRQRGTRSG
jgi:tRNA A-37 threonylcarbamoyl transferase component Bud32